MIETKNLRFGYTQNKRLLSYPDIQLKAQEDLLILGKSGVGKTTLLHLLCGLLKPKNGEIWIHDTLISNLSPNRLDQFRGENIGIVLQKSNALHALRVYQNLEARLFFSKAKVNNNRIAKLLEELDLNEVKNAKIQELSVGELQRLGVALAVIHNPKIILADEPTSNLDDENCELVINLLQRQAHKNKANLIVITHDHRIKSSFKNAITL